MATRWMSSNRYRSADSMYGAGHRDDGIRDSAARTANLSLQSALDASGEDFAFHTVGGMRDGAGDAVD